MCFFSSWCILSTLMIYYDIVVFLSYNASQLKKTGQVLAPYFSEEMEKSSYVPPRYIPLGQSDREESDLEKSILSKTDQSPTKNESIIDVPVQWSSGICACFDDLQSCTLTSTFQPCFFSILWIVHVSRVIIGGGNIDPLTNKWVIESQSGQIKKVSLKREPVKRVESCLKCIFVTHNLLISSFKYFQIVFVIIVNAPSIQQDKSWRELGSPQFHPVFLIKNDPFLPITQPAQATYVATSYSYHRVTRYCILLHTIFIF